MNKLLITLVPLIIFSWSLELAAANTRTKNNGIRFEEDWHNSCCHWCRISINRETKKGINYRGCPNPDCKMSFCGRKKCPGNPNPFTKEGCLVCLDNCCCKYYECQEDHKHCFTSKRTEARHEAKAPKWSAKKKNSIKQEDMQRTTRKKNRTLDEKNDDIIEENKRVHKGATNNYTGKKRKRKKEEVDLCIRLKKKPRLIQTIEQNGPFDAQLHEEEIFAGKPNLKANSPFDLPPKIPADRCLALQFDQCSPNYPREGVCLHDPSAENGLGNEALSRLTPQEIAELEEMESALFGTPLAIDAIVIE